MFYRNIVDLVSPEGIEVDEGSLWIRSDESESLTLVDEDQYATHEITSDFEID